MLSLSVWSEWKSLSRVRLCDPMDCIVCGILQAGILEWVSVPILQRIFPTQGWNLGLPHCRRILYWLSHWGSPGDSRVKACVCNHHSGTASGHQFISNVQDSHTQRVREHTGVRFPPFEMCHASLLGIFLDLKCFEIFLLLYFGHEACVILGSPPRDRTHAPCIGSVEFSPLDC